MDERELEVRKLELQLARHKFWIGSVALVLATTLLNWQIQEREIQVKQIEQENAHLSRFVAEILDRDPLTRLYIAEYFKTLSYSEAARERWESYNVIAKQRAEDELAAERRKMEIELRLGSLVEELADPATSEERATKIREEIFEARIETSEVLRRLEALNPQRARRSSERKPSTISSGSDVGPRARTRVADTTVFPWSRICRVLLTGDQTYEKTGFLVSPRLVVTSGAGLLDGSIGVPLSALRSSVACGQDGDFLPFDERVGSTIKVLDVGQGAGSNDPVWEWFNDLAGIVLSRPIPGHAGAVAIEAAADDGLVGAEVTLAGYPLGSDKVQFRVSGPIVEVNEAELRYEAKLRAEGAPILVRSAEGYSIVGFESWWSASDTASLSGGVRLSPAVADTIRGWIAEAEGSRASE